MNRLFETHPRRNVQSLDGLWQFKTDPDNKGIEEKWYEAFPGNTDKVYVPSCWNNELGLYEYEGVAWYKTTFDSVDETVKLHFHGVTGQAKVYLDGLLLGEHYGGFTGFEFLIENLEPGQHTLTVYVDSTHDDMNTIPLAVVDWYHYGGITRGVEVVTLPTQWIEDYKIDYTLADDYKSAKLHCIVNLGGKQASPEQKITLLVDGVTVASFNINDATYEAELKDLNLWHPNHPYLYNISLVIEEDTIVDRIGFRKIEGKNKQLLINGQPIYLNGVNRHEDHPDWGFALPLKIMMKDMAIIKQMGCNMIRGSHYPNAPAFLDLCDQEGILFMEEIPMWGFGEAQMSNPIVEERGLMMHEEMIVRDYHHPCIFLWGLHNECATDTEAGYRLTKIFADKVRSLDSTRLVGYASNKADRDICFELADIICVNRYIGWYFKDIDYWPTFLQTVKDNVAKHNCSDKPIVMSEFGAGAVYGESTFEGPIWTENFQQKYLDYTLKLFKDDPDISGSMIWQYCDIRTAKEKALDRPRGFNNKGLVDEFRRPKSAYWTVQKHYTAE